MPGDLEVENFPTNRNFEGTPHGNGSWVEVIHEAPGWTTSIIQYVADEKIQGAEVIPLEGSLRVFRVRARQLEFCLIEESEASRRMDKSKALVGSGRYLVRGSGPAERVSDACLDACLRSLRPKDRFVEIMFEPDPLWLRTFMVRNQCCEAWTDPPGFPLRKMHPGVWFIRLAFDSNERGPMEFTFNDGGRLWHGENYKIGCPGKYHISGGHCQWIGPADLDLHM